MKAMLVAVCFLEVDGKIPLIKFKRNHLKNHWALPGGKFDSEEFLPEAAVREMKEEIGCDVKFDTFHGVVDEIARFDGGAVRPILFVATVVPAGPVTVERRETDEGVFDWFTREEIGGLESEFVPNDFRILQEIMFGGKTGYYESQQTVTDTGISLDFFRRA